MKNNETLLGESFASSQQDEYFALRFTKICEDVEVPVQSVDYEEHKQTYY